MQKIAASLAAQMTAAGITTSNVHNHPAYCPGTLPLLVYAMDNGEPVLGRWACCMRQDGDDWLLWDDKGTKRTRITHDGTRWTAQPAETV